MKILMQNRPEGLWKGGDWNQLRRTAEALIKKGIDVEIDDQQVYSPALLYRSFDIIHTFNFSMKWTKLQTALAKMYKKPVVCSMIYHESDEFVNYEDQQKVLDLTDKCVFLSTGEIGRVRRHLKLDDSKIVVIPNGIDKFWFKRVVGSSPGYVLTVARIEPFKGQLACSIACKALGLTYICVGERTDEQYAKECEKEGAILTGKLEGGDLLKMYSACSVYCLPSRAEIFPLSVMEAGAQAKNIVLTDHSEYKDIPNVEWCKWNDIESIGEAVSRAMEKGDNFEFRDKLKLMTWDKVADDLIEVYKNLLS